MMRYNPSEIEAKWQKKWADDQIYTAKDFDKRPNFVMLTEFPYPSGDQLHMGHMREYTLGDIISRYKRAQGMNVLFPMGFDAFGLPAENYAIKNKTTPQAAVAQNIANARGQLESMGYSIDWGRSFSTTDPEFYRWTQWMFLQFYKTGLAYQDEIAINWCPFCKTGLANEEVVNGRHERCDNLVEKKTMKQWMLRITDYADRLIDGLQDVDYPSRIADQQVNWIGKSEGAEIEFEISESPHFLSAENPPRSDKRFTKRKFVMAFVYDPKADKYLAIKWQKFPWISVVGGGIEENEDIVEAAKREVLEETGYKNIKFKRILGKYESEFYAANKDVNREIDGTMILFELVDDEQVETSSEEKEIQIPVWLKRSEFKRENMPAYDETMQGLEWIDSEGERARIKVFTTRPDTIFGATFMVLAPEHPLVEEITTDDRRKEVNSYIATAQSKSELERQESKEKTGVFTGGYAINPMTNEKMPIWIADYVLASYGEGAIMAVPAHDERDNEFATKFNLPIKQAVMPYILDTLAPPKPDAPDVRRDTVIVHLLDKSTNKFALLSWHKELEGMITAIMGGIENGETIEEAALREIREEAGVDARIVQISPWSSSASYFAPHKNENRTAVARVVLAEVDNLDGQKIDADEEQKHTLFWTDKDKVMDSLVPEHQKLVWSLIRDGSIFHGKGILMGPGEFDGMISKKAGEVIIKQLEKQGVGKKRTTYKLRDWVYSRQHYWGEPIPIIHCEKCGAVPVPESDLPVTLPEVDHYEPTDTGESPLAAIESWVNVSCPKCGAPAKRETDTMPNWAGSNWYYLRYFDAHNNEAFADPEKLKYWSPVDLYLGGMEHTTLHLLYSRFHHQFLYDQGLVPTPEPYAARRGQGIILASDGTKMSKSKGNVVNPTTIIESGYGADALRLAVTFLAPYDQTTPWSPEGVAGNYRFLGRFWNLALDIIKAQAKSSSNEAQHAIHKTIKKVSDDLEKMNFNTAIAALMEVVNDLNKIGADKIETKDFEKLIQLLAPFAPHITEELWCEKFGHTGSVHISDWPKCDEKYLETDEITIAVQVNGKLRGEVKISKDASEDDIKKAALELENVQSFTGDKKPARIIYVPGKIVNIVLA